MICLHVAREWNEKFVQKIACHTHVNVKFKLSCTIQNLNFLTLQQFCLPIGLPACLPAVKPSFTMARAPVFSYNKVIYKTAVLKKVHPQHHDASFYPLLVSFRLQITHRKVRNLQIGVNKLLGKVSISLLRHSKFSQLHACIISIISHVPAIHNSAVKVVHLNKLI